MTVITELGVGYSPTAPTEAQLRGRKLGYRPSGGAQILLCFHSAGGFAPQPIQTSPYRRVLEALIEAGLMLVSPDLGGPATWMTDAVVSRSVEALAWARANGGSDEPAILAGSSMGGGNAIKFAREHPEEVAAYVGFAPVSDLNDMHANNRANQTAAINTAYGGAYDNATHGPDHNPLLLAPELADLPGQIWESTQDTVVVPATVEALAAAWGDNCELHTGAWGDHGADANFANVDLPQLLEFVATHR